MQTNRTHVNPILGDKITFVRTSRETGGQSSLLELELVPLAQGTPPHYHDRFAETFTVLAGELTVRTGNQLRKLRPGQTYTVPPGTKHCFCNAQNAPVRAIIELNPASEGFENGIKIAYGLARDGQCNAKGLTGAPWKTCPTATSRSGWPCRPKGPRRPTTTFRWTGRRTATRCRAFTTCPTSTCTST